MQTSTCNICYAAKTPSEYSSATCHSCSTHRDAAEKTFSTQNPLASESDILYVGRMSLEQRRASSQKKYISPSNFNRSMSFVKDRP